MTEILAHGPLLQQPHTRNQIRALQSGGELKRRLKITGVFLAGFALVALLVSMLMGMMVRSLVARVPVEWEQELGDKVMAEVKEMETFIENAKLQTNLIQAVAPLLRAVPTNSLGFKFYLMDTPLPNAFALPGGHVVVTTSLLALAERPEEIAGVVAHELAHVTKKHGSGRSSPPRGLTSCAGCSCGTTAGCWGCWPAVRNCWSAKASPRNTKPRPMTWAGNTWWRPVLIRAAWPTC